MPAAQAICLLVTDSPYSASSGADRFDDRCASLFWWERRGPFALRVGRGSVRHRQNLN
jgi:hypothetical protein